MDVMEIICLKRNVCRVPKVTKKRKGEPEVRVGEKVSASGLNYFKTNQICECVQKMIA